MNNNNLLDPYRVGESPALLLGGIVLDGKLLSEAPVNLVLKSLNRHGLIAGATGSGKTKTMQVLAEQLSLAGVPSLVMDIKGDISGLAMPGVASEFINDRNKSLGITSNMRGFPVELLTLGESVKAVPMRASVTDFGAILFARMLDVNETQSGAVTVIFEYAKEKKISLVDLADFKTLLQYMQTDAGKADIESRFGAVSGSSTGIILRKIIELEAQGGGAFFGEPAFNVMDLVRTNPQGEGIISILQLMNMQETPKLFSTFMLKLLTDVYRLLPELGDPPKPVLTLFIDEAHLIFNHASKALLNLLDTMVKLIRSKGVSLIFCTQTPNDIPDAVLSQLGLKIQHALRAFTAKDRQAMKLVAQNFPPSEYYHTEQLLTSLGIGEALVTALDAKGQPTPLVQCMVRAPQSRMGVITLDEMKNIVAQSTLFATYRLRKTTRPASEYLPEINVQERVATKGSGTTSGEKAEPDMLTNLSKNTLFRQIVRQIFREITNVLLKILGVKKGR